MSENHRINFNPVMPFTSGGLVPQKDNDQVAVLADRGWWKCKNCGAVFEFPSTIVFETSATTTPLNHICDPTKIFWCGQEITAKDGLLWCDGQVIDLPGADHLAQKYGFGCAEQLVKAMSEKEETS